MTQQGKDRKKSDHVWHEGTTTDLQLSIYVGVLPILMEHVMVSQVGIFYLRLMATLVYIMLYFTTVCFTFTG